MEAMCVVHLFEVSTACVSLNYRSVMITMNWLSFVILCQGSMSMAMSQKICGPGRIFFVMDLSYSLRFGSFTAICYDCVYVAAHVRPVYFVY